MYIKHLLEERASSEYLCACMYITLTVHVFIVGLVNPIDYSSWDLYQQDKSLKLGL